MLFYLGNALYSQGKYQEAKEGVFKALAIRREVLGEEHPDTAQSYNSVALILYSQGKYQEAKEGHLKALAIRRKVLGEEHPDTAQSYNSVALILYAQGKYQEAKEGHLKALAIRRKVLGEEHPDTAQSYNSVALILYAQGKYQEAEKYWLRAADVFAKARLHVADTGLERATITSEHSPLPALATVLARNGKIADAWQRFEESLACGTWDDLTARLRRPAAELAKQAQLVARLGSLDRLIAQIVSAKELTPEQTKQREELLTQQRQALDELADFDRHLEDAYGPAAGKVFPREKIQASLPPDAAMIGWLDLPGQHQAADPNGEHWAVLLRSAGPPVWVRLRGSGEQHAWTDVDTGLPAHLRAALQSSTSEWQPLADRLRKQRLDPLAPHLKDVRRLIVLPATPLAGVPVEVIADGYTVSYAHSATMYAHLRQRPAPSGKGLFVLADPVFQTPAVVDKPQPLPPGGVLLTMVLPRSNADQAGLRSSDVLLRYGDKDLAGPADFKPWQESSDHKQRVPVVVWREGKALPRPLSVRPGKLGVAIASEPAPQALAEQRRWDRWLASRRSDGEKWDKLPGTRIEAASLHRLFDKDAPVRRLLDSDASEQRLNELAQRGELGNYRYLHLATHSEVDNTMPLRSAVILSCDQLPDENKRLQLLLSGQPIPDGRLTAEKVLRQWHLDSELVTLSACQTALGKYERGEGFVGFAQALILSGSRSVCLSLWMVNDSATVLLMERFYQNLLGKRAGLKAPLPKAAALAEAKEWLRKLPRAEALKRAAFLSEGVERGPRPMRPSPEMPPANPTTANADRPYAHPYYWAPFVLIGDPN
jgi:tetratricopeptide (TPR) repeat protein